MMTAEQGQAILLALIIVTVPFALMWLEAALPLGVRRRIRGFWLWLFLAGIGVSIAFALLGLFLR